jgi:hypothetical protein
MRVICLTIGNINVKKNPRPRLSSLAALALEVCVQLGPKPCLLEDICLAQELDFSCPVTKPGVRNIALRL